MLYWLILISTGPCVCPSANHRLRGRDRAPLLAAHDVSGNQRSLGSVSGIERNEQRWSSSRSSKCNVSVWTALLFDNFETTTSFYDRFAWAGRFFSVCTLMKTFPLVLVSVSVTRGKGGIAQELLLWPTGFDSGTALCDSCCYLTVSHTSTLSSWLLNTSGYGLCYEFKWEKCRHLCVQAVKLSLTWATN